MTLGERCGEIIRLVDEALDTGAPAGAAGAPVPVAPPEPSVRVSLAWMAVPLAGR